MADENGVLLDGQRLAIDFKNTTVSSQQELADLLHKAADQIAQKAWEQHDNGAQVAFLDGWVIDTGDINLSIPNPFG